MGITIIQNENGFTYDKKNYKFGESLIEFVNQDFSELKKFIMQDISSNPVTYEKAFDFLFKSINEFKNCNKSIYFELMQNTLICYYNQAKEADDYDKPFLYTEIHLNKFMHYVSLFFGQLLDCRNHIKEIFQTIDYNLPKNKTLIQKLQKIYSTDIRNNTNTSNQFITLSEKKQFFIPISKSKLSPFDYCEEVSHIKLVFNKNCLNYELFFPTIEEFCNFELKAILDQKIPVAICPYKKCKKPFIKKHMNQKYCSSNCREKHIDANHTEIYNLYRKRSKYLNNKYNNPLNDLLPENFPSEKLMNLYNKYKDLDDKNEKILKEYKNKLKEIK